MLPRCVVLVPLLMLTGISAFAAGLDTDVEADEESLRAAHISVDGASLLTLFRKRTPDPEAQAHLKTRIAQLGSAVFLEREEASEELAASGVEATGMLRQASSHADLEIRRRAREALAVVEQGDLSEDVLNSALRLLARRKPPQMIEVLLAYSPHAASADITETLYLTLSSVAVRDGEVDPLLARALSARSPRQRGVAAAAICRAGCAKQLPDLRRLLRDPDVQVRRRVALALLEGRDKAAVPVLIDLLAKLPLEEVEQIEALLLQIAGDDPPKDAFPEDGKRGSSISAWAEWWRRHGDAIDLGKRELAPHWRGYTLAICMTALRRRGGRMGCLVELDARGRTRWQMPGLSYPVDAQVIDERRVLVTEYRSGQVTERNHNGDILRRIEVADSPLEARHLPNGRTLITTRGRVFEVDRHDKEVWSAKVSGEKGIIMSACPLPGGQIGICYAIGDFVRQDRSGKVLASFQVGRILGPTGSHIQGLPNGHLLVPLYYDSKVVEFDGEGREVWSAKFARPVSAQRLPNGRTLVAGHGSNVIVELDRNGREVKSQQCDGRLMSVRGR